MVRKLNKMISFWIYKINFINFFIFNFQKTIIFNSFIKNTFDIIF